MSEVKIILPPRADQSKMIDFGLVALTEAIAQINPEVVGGGCLGGEFGYGAHWDNDVFTMRTYYWGDCDCGADEREAEWSAAHKHADDCFRTVLHASFDKYDRESGYSDLEAARGGEGLMVHSVQETDLGAIHISKRTTRGEELHKRWCSAYDKRNKAHEKLTRELYRERGIKPTPYQWLCTCGHDKLFSAWAKDNGHRPTCALELPNFLHKRTGMEVRWYKWIGRGMESVNVPKDGAAVFRECMESLSNGHVTGTASAS